MAIHNDIHFKYDDVIDQIGNRVVYETGVRPLLALPVHNQFIITPN